MLKDKWMLKNKLGDFAHIRETFSVCEATARLLVNRGLTEDDDIRHFLYPSFSDIRPSAELPNLNLMLQFLKAAVKEQKKIRIFGDYDVDGVTATFLCMKALRKLSANVDYRIPDRKTDGYGISEAMVEEAIRDGVEVILTVDNGITAVDRTKTLKEHGITVLITDHHEPQESIPEADAVCDPKLLPEGQRAEICGAVVGAKIMDALLNEFSVPGYFADNIDIAALATVCDVMPLTGENRAIVKLGLASLRRNGNFGLTKLMEACKVNAEALSTYTFGFVLGPCINALGRLEKADAGVELLLTSDSKLAEELSTKMVAVNEKRKLRTFEQEQSALDKLFATDWESKKTTVCYLPDCPESIAGIVAGRIRKTVNRPVIVFTDSDDPDILKASARSIEGVSVFDIIYSCKDLTVRFGGHEQAAGLSVRRADFPEFKRSIEEASDFDDELLIPKRIIDIVMPLHLLNEQMISEMSLLEPFGNGNNSPLFACRKVILTGLKQVGQKNRFWKFTVRENPLTNDSNSWLGKPVTLSGLSFEDVDELEKEFVNAIGDERFNRLLYGRGDVDINLLYVPKINEFNGNRTIEISVEGYQIC